MAGQVYIAVFGKIAYEDIFNVKHWVKFCVFESAQGSQDALPCVEFNGTDSDIR
jgi:hypothetical protein